MAGTPAGLVALDWGTTRLRAYRVAPDGAILERRDSPRGILSVGDGDFEAVLDACAGDWLGPSGAPAVLASGMIGSRQGWHEVPYLGCPARLEDIGRAVAVHRTRSGIPIHFVPGLAIDGADGVPDVMRGEETQVLGAGDAAGNRLVLLPGTHSKWVRTAGDAIEWFATFMTGELFGALVEHTILGRPMAGTASHEAAFERGVRYGASRDPGSGGLLKRLFSARTLGLFDTVAPEGLHSYLSGLLIGTEIAEATSACGLDAATTVTLIGSDDLCARYRAALEILGHRAEAAPPDCAAIGLWRIGREMGAC